MRNSLALSFCVLLSAAAITSCARDRTVFSQGSIKISLPVKALSENGVMVICVWDDSDTKMFGIVDRTGLEYQVYLHRQYSPNTNDVFGKGPDAFYLNGFPGSGNGVLIKNPKRFRTLVLKDIDI